MDKIKSSINVQKTNFLFVKTGPGRYAKITTNDIIFIEGLRDYIGINTKDKRVVVNSSMKFIQTLLGNNFLRVHKSFIVNLSAICIIKNGSIFFENNHIERRKEVAISDDGYKKLRDNYIVI